MNLHPEWNHLNDEQEVERLIEESYQRPVALFKHSTRCGISHFVKDSLHSNWRLNSEKLGFYLIDLLNFRQLSNHVAERFGIAHQSPQLILLHEGKPIYNASHQAISVDELHAVVADKISE